MQPQKNKKPLVIPSSNNLVEITPTLTATVRQPSPAQHGSDRPVRTFLCILAMLVT